MVVPAAQNEGQPGSESISTNDRTWLCIRWKCTEKERVGRIQLGRDDGDARRGGRVKSNQTRRHVSKAVAAFSAAVGWALQLDVEGIVA